jgi:hypothetical protein
MLYRDKIGNIIIINRCDYKNDHIYYKAIMDLKRGIHKDFNNVIENAPKDTNRDLCKTFLQ